MLTCDFKYAPDCEGFAEVAMATPGIAANACQQTASTALAEEIDDARAALAEGDR